MTELTVLNNKFENSTVLKTDITLDAESINTPVVHQAVKAALANRRQGNAKTKGRSEVRGGGRKPFKQKGTGRARQGSTRSPLMPGGGNCFGPSPRDFSQSVNKKVALKAIQSVIADKYQAGKLTVVEQLESTGKTKDMYKNLSDKGLLPALVVTAQRDSKTLQAVKNLRQAKGQAVEGFSVYEAVKYENLIIEKAALETLLKRLV